MSDDLISRSALLERLCHECSGRRCGCGSTFCYYDLIMEASAVDAEPVRHGRWLEHYPNDIWDRYQCSCCKARRANKTKYCPNCGAKMDGDANAPKS